MTFDYRRRILGYADRVRARPGDTIDFKISLEDHQTFEFRTVRIVCAVATPEGAPYREVAVETPANGRHNGSFQRVDAGSYAVIPAAPVLDRLQDFTFQAFIMPTLPGDGRQVIISRGSGPARPGFAVILDSAGALALMVGNGGDLVTVSTGRPLQPWKWAFVAARYNATDGAVTVSQNPLIHTGGSSSPLCITGQAPSGVVFAGDHDLHMAAWQTGWHEDGKPRMVGHFNGRIDSPRLASRALEDHEMAELARPGTVLPDWVVGAWDFAENICGDTFPDRSGNALHGHLVNLPSRGVTGRQWDGSCHDWRECPDHYAAIHFHDDDLFDAGWQTTVSMAVPDSLASGIYAAHCRAGDDTCYIPFVVVPGRGASRERVAFLASTATWLAYANNHWQLDEEKAEVKRGRIIAYSADELFLHERRDLGLSTYDTHRDGSGVFYSSRLRPLVNNHSPQSAIWSFNADTHVTDWLEASGIPFDVITDDDLHEDGVAALADYRVIITGTHPEYWTTAMLDGLEAYLDGGGRLMYLGGNGFYWRIACHPTRGGEAIEVRRPESGARFWASRPGEYHLSFNGERGGLWKHIGRPPQSLVGIGTFATGFDRAGWFVKKPGTDDNPRASWIFEGVEGDIIGDFGVLGGGAAGIELDGADEALGTPPETIVLASSEGHSAYYMQSPDEIVFNHAAVTADANPRVRADMVYFTLPSGAGVFSTGSISWAASLGWNDYDNNVARITGNVVRRFAADAALP